MVYLASAYELLFGGLVAVCAVVKAAQLATERPAAAQDLGDPRPEKKRDPAFTRFQANYLLVFLLAVTSDWLQGPYVYALYSDYGYQKDQIATLFIAGFASSALFGTFIGSLADTFGRKKNVVVFAVSYGLSCITKHSPNFFVLLLGRVLGGVATSILFSAFEAWLVYEHNARGYASDKLSETFAHAQFGNGLLAIASGQVAGFFADRYGKTAPFDISLFVLVVLGVLVIATWTENYGDSKQSCTGGFRNAWAEIVASPEICLLGVIQSAYEGAMYTFVFLWTPVLQAASDEVKAGEIRHGIIFSTFMVAVMIGSTLYTFLLRWDTEERFLRYVFLASAALFAHASLSKNVWSVYGCFVAFELLCGIYFPTISTLRSKYVPEANRAAIMSIFRIPLNVIVVALLYSNLGTERVLLYCVGLLMAGALCQQKLCLLSK